MLEAALLFLNAWHLATIVGIAAVAGVGLLLFVLLIWGWKR